MPHDARAYLWDVLDSAEDIQRFLSGVDEAGYAENALVHSAVERKFEVIPVLAEGDSRGLSRVG